MRILVNLFIGCHCKSFIVKVLDSRLEVQPNDTLHWGVGGEVLFMMTMTMTMTRTMTITRTMMMTRTMMTMTMTAMTDNDDDDDDDDDDMPR